MHMHMPSLPFPLGAADRTTHSKTWGHPGGRSWDLQCNAGSQSCRIHVACMAWPRKGGSRAQNMCAHDTASSCSGETDTHSHANASPLAAGMCTCHLPSLFAKCHVCTCHHHHKLREDTAQTLCYSHAYERSRSCSVQAACRTTVTATALSPPPSYAAAAAGSGKGTPNSISLLKAAAKSCAHVVQARGGEGGGWG